MSVLLDKVRISSRVLCGVMPPADTYWYATLGGANADIGSGITTDLLGNIYIVGGQQSQGQGGNDIIIAKYNSSGTLQWQRGLGGSNYDTGEDIVTDSAGNIYITGLQSSQGQGSNDIIIAKYNSSGALQWQRGLGGAAGDTGYGLVIDSSDNIYVLGYQSSQVQGTHDIIIAKYNSAGTFQWQQGLRGAAADLGFDIAIDPANNLYIVGYQDSQSQGNFDIIVAKLNSSGTLQWQRGLGGTNREDGYAIAVDTLNNVYVTGYYQPGAGEYSIIIAKYNSSGTFQWQRALSGAAYEQGDSITTDSSNNVYVVGRQASQGQGNNDIIIAKYDSLGTLQWQRGLGGTASDTGLDIKVDSSNNLLITGFQASQGQGGNDILIVKLPNDGSLTGTYGSLTYYVSTLTATTPTLTATTPTLTQTTPTLTQTTPTLTQTTPTLVSNTVVIG